MRIEDIVARGYDAAYGAPRLAHARPRRVQAPPGAARREDHAPRLRPRPPLSDHQRLQQVAAGGMQVYDRAALRLSDKQRRDLEAQGRKPHWRFLIEYRETRWLDGIRGEQIFHGNKLSDPVLVRADGTPTYTLASVVDDTELGITHVIRGEDHVANTAVQLQIFEALGASESISFAHFSLLTDSVGHNLSKRLGSLSIRSLREEGLEPMAINALLARLGTSDPVRAARSAACAHVCLRPDGL
jgi:glutamyl-tRNA synthetase